ncbi:MAG: hypothetical protein A2937_02840 [Candidatus Yonathbacteria bacterium RIFCSPLOWO2_01_FULL_47_33b]|uniref:Uncharacterized protein n=1 Tax=Candidatus Yonathbacteria bacterium RIFCSPLOWO2_01_FULL_47_33b TaxID=1802727 RepID=A0A1G2SGF7_9BACT|nr:MAG: hypothetical protein A2937_02840 [Candidatus Yonathbacteria bacterium RIFCSPLOWO2_01_FULL_47_33b]
MNDRTPLPPKQVPGWFIALQVAVLQQLPRPEDGMDKVTALRWTDNQGDLKQNLASLVTPPRIQLSNKGIGILHTFDIFVPNDIDELRTKYSSDKNIAVQKLTPGQKLKVDLIMNGHHLPIRDCINVLRSSGALFLGEVGSMLIINAQAELNKKQMRIPLSDQWMASFDEKNAALEPASKGPLVPGIIGPLYSNYGRMVKTTEELDQDGLTFFFSFHDAS